MKTPSRILEDVERRLDATWHQTVTGNQDGWPLRLPLGRPSTTDLVSRFLDVQRWAISWRTWADDHGLILDWENRNVSGTRQSVPTHLMVPDPNSAADLLGSPWPGRLHRGSVHWKVLSERFPHAATSARVRYTSHLTDIDFRLLCDAAAWFATHDAAGLTPRQVAIEGLHGKWLNNHRAIVTALAGRDTLGLTDRPTRVHFTYLDPGYRAIPGHRLHDSITVGDEMTPPYAPVLAVIAENKDTAVYFPPVPGGIAIEGNGFAAPALLPRIPWLTRTPRIVYWGDIDAAGYEIVDRLRGAGMPVQTVLMDSASYAAFEEFGAWTDNRGNPIPCSPRKDLVNLTPAERVVYESITDSVWTRARRIEQERIPLDVALARVMEGHVDLSTGDMP